MKKEKKKIKAYLDTYINIALRENMKLNRRYLNQIFQKKTRYIKHNIHYTPD